MAYPMALPENCKIVDATAGPVTTNGGVTGEYVSLKNAHKAWLVLQFTQAASHATVVTAQQAKTVAGGDAETVPENLINWRNSSTAATDTLVQLTDAKTVTLATGAHKAMVVIEIDPALFGDTFDCAGFTVSDSSQATNFVSGVWVLATRYPGQNPPSAIID